MKQSAMSLNQAEQTFLIIDGHALIYRSFHAFPPLTTNNGELVGAVYGFLRVLLTVLKQVEPSHWLVAFDHPAPTKRKLAFDFYKANRPEMPQELRSQVSLIEEAVVHLGIPEYKIAGIEADDIIGTVAKLAVKSGVGAVRILTGDKDSFQLVDEHIHVLVPNVGRAKNKGDKSALIEYGSALVEQKMGVSPQYIVDFKALAGDSSDNITGVPGIGAKTAAALIQKYGSVEHIYQLLDQELLEKEKSGVLSKLSAGRQSAMVSKQLATIDVQVELDFNLDNCRVGGYQKEQMYQFLQRLGFTSLLKLLPADDFDLDLQQTLF